MKDESGAFVQISPKTSSDQLERIVCIEGDLSKRNRALSMVVRKIADDPQHSSMPGLNYAAQAASSGGGGGGGGSMSGGGGGNDFGSSAASGGAKFDFNAAANYLGEPLIALLSIIGMYLNKHSTFSYCLGKMENSRGEKRHTYFIFGVLTSHFG